MVFENDQTALRLRSHGATVVSRPSTGTRSKNFDILSSVSMSTAGSCIEHVVQRGDWLYDIGRRHNVDVGTLLIANPSLRNPDSLLVGSRISIPRKSSSSSSSFYTPPSTSSRASAPRAKAHREQSTRSAFTSLLMRPEMLSLSKTFSLLGQILSCKDREHRVGDGESLACLAEKYGTTVKALKKLNNMEDDVIYSGSVLKIDWHSADRAVLGRKASVQERNSLIDDVSGNATQPIKVVNPVLSTYPRSERLQRVHPIPIQETVRVKYGDTLVDIASAHGMSSEELQRLNNLRNENIFEGDVLAVSAGSSVKELSENRSGRRRSNRLLFSRQCAGFHQKLGVGGPEQTLKEQLITGNLKLEGRWKRKRKGFQLAQDKWVRFSSPVTEGSLSSTFGWRWGAFHEGVDVAADQGSPILASDKGTVTFAGWSGGYGYLVAIQHEGGFVTRYAHCCAIHSRVGQQVVKGQQVAAVGATGRATGPHLHFEVRKNGEALDPLKWVIL